VVLLGRGSRALRAAGGVAAPTRRRDAHHHRERPAGELHACAAPSARPARRSAGARDPGRPLGDRPGQLPRCPTSCSVRGRCRGSSGCSSASASTSCTCTSR
jgi:hypothetical protein